MSHLPYLTRVRESNWNRWISRLLFTFMVIMQIIRVTTLVGQTADHWHQLFFHYGAFYVLVYCFLTKSFSKKELLIYGALFLFIFIQSRVHAFNHHFLYMIACNVLIKDENIDWAIKKLFHLYTLAVTSVILLSLAGVIATVEVIRGGEIPRHSLGFLHPNTTSIMILVCFMIYLLSLKKSISIRCLLFFSFAYAAILYFIDSRTPFLLLILLVMYVILDKVINIRYGFIDRRKTSIFATSLLGLSLGMISYFGSKFFFADNAFLNWMNRLLSFRLSLGQYFIQNYTMSFFGGDIVQSIEPWRVLDNGYLNTLFIWGPFYLMIVLLIIMTSTAFLQRRGFLYATIILCIFFVYGVSESIFMSLPFNPLLFLWGNNLGLKENNGNYSNKK